MEILERRHRWVFFVILGICAILHGAGRRSPLVGQLAVLPAVCVGLAAGSKYPYGLLLLSVMIAIWLFMDRGRRLEATIVAAGMAVLSFLAVVPYSVIDLPAFLNGLARETYHYAVVQYSGQGASSSLHRFWDCVSFLFGEFGVVVFALFLIGLVSTAIWCWRRTLVLVSFPVALLALLSMQQVQFTRNILPLFPFVATFSALGFYLIYVRFFACLRNFEWTFQDFET